MGNETTYTQKEVDEGLAAVGRITQYFYNKGARDAFIGVGIGVLVAAVVDVASGTVVPFIKNKINERICKTKEES